MADWNELHNTVTVTEPHMKVVKFVDKYLQPGMRVLDLGCGKGRHSIYCAQKGFEVHSVDASKRALAELKAEIEKDQLFELVKVTHANMSELPFPNNYFDAIICTNVIQHGYKKDIKQYFKEASRVLDKGGYFFLITTGRDFVSDFIGPETKEVEPGTYLNLKVIDGEEPHHALTKEEIEELLKDFKIIKFGNFTERSQWMDVDATHLKIIAKKKSTTPP